MVTHAERSNWNMIKFLLPEISFAGRLSRGAFWREIALSFMWTPIVIAITGFLLKEAAVVTDGIAGTGLSAGSLVGIAIFGLGVRNMVAMLGMIKRRMNDRGYGASGLLKTTWPLLGILLLIPFTLINPMLIMFYVPLVFVQVIFTFRAIGDLLLGSSYDTADPSTTRDPWENLSAFAAASKTGDAKTKDPLGDIRKQLALLAAGVVKGVQNIEAKPTGSAPWAERILKDVQTLGDKVSRHDFVREAIQKLERMSEIKHREMGSRADERWPDKQRPAPRTKKIYQSPTSQPVRVARRQPKHGRSSLLDGLIAGPWG